MSAMGPRSPADGPSAVDPPGPADRDEGERRPALLVAAAVVVVLVVGLVLTFGLARPPALDPVGTDAADPGTAIAWTTWQDGDTCVHVLQPGGDRSHPVCGALGDLLAWDDDGLVFVSWQSAGARLEVVDPATGDVVGDRLVTDRDLVPAESDDVVTRHDDGQLVVELRSPRTELWRVDAPDVYGVDLGSRSPDGSHVALLDRAGRLLVVPADGSAPPRVWAEGLPRWTQLVWQGTAVPAT